SATEKVKFFPTPLKPLPLPSLGPSRAQDEVVGGSLRLACLSENFAHQIMSYRLQSPTQVLWTRLATPDSDSALFLTPVRCFWALQIASKRLEIDAWVILFAWMLSFGPPEIGPLQIKSRALDSNSTLNSTPEDPFFSHKRTKLSHEINSRTLDSNSTLNSTPEDPFFSHKRTKLSHEVQSLLTSTPTLVPPRACLLSTHIRFTLCATQALSLLLDRDLAFRIAQPFLLGDHSRLVESYTCLIAWPGGRFQSKNCSHHHVQEEVEGHGADAGGQTEEVVVLVNVKRFTSDQKQSALLNQCTPLVENHAIIFVVRLSKLWPTPLKSFQTECKKESLVRLVNVITKALSSETHKFEVLYLVTKGIGNDAKTRLCSPLNYVTSQQPTSMLSRAATQALRTKTYRLNNVRNSSTQLSKTEQHLIDIVNNSKHPMVKVAAIDIDGVPRGKYIDKNKFVSTLKNGSAFCSVVFGWDCADELYDRTKSVGWHMGYADFETSLDPKTFRQVPWEDDMPFLLMDYTNKKTGEGLPVCPRSLLKKVDRIIGELKDEGFTAHVGCEYEFFNYLETPKTIRDKGYVNPEPLTPGMFGYSLLRTGRNREYISALMHHLHKFGIPIEGLHTETGPGVLEAAIQYSEALEAADRAILFKMGSKDIARDFGIIPTFMAKPSASLPGCGGHMHMSLTDEKNHPVFFDEKGKDKMSDTFRHFLAGQMHCLPQIMPMYAPTINSYKRFVEGYWAPTTATWGVENRTVSFRVIGGSPKSLRVEVRIPGADCNPYLGIAASLASGLYGIKNKLELPPPTGGSAYGDKGKGGFVQETLPKNLHEAAQRMNESKVAREILGEEFVDHFAETRIWEWRKYQTAVTNWEIERYFEII
ncbi:L-glutamine synthetase, partial [Planoprotostelium fungivorum]